MMQDIKNYLLSIGINSYLYEQPKYSYKFGYLVISSTVEKYCFLKWMYKDKESFYLNRKHERSQAFMYLVENNITNRKNNLSAVEYYKKSMPSMVNVITNIDY